MASVKARKLVLASGSEFYGEGFGAEREAVCEVVFNTSMAGYQEIVSDPSYTDQAVCMTYPVIGNYGITDEDFETKTPTIGALIVRDYNDNPSNFRYTKTLSELMQEYDIPGLSGIDTRRLTREIRSEGSQKGLLCAADTPIEWAMEVLGLTEIPHDQVSRVSCKKRWYSRTSNHRYTVVAIDCGGEARHGEGPRRARLQRHCRALEHPGGGDRVHAARRHPALERPRRPDGRARGRGDGAEAARPLPHHGHMPRPSDTRPRPRREDL